MLKLVGSAPRTPPPLRPSQSSCEDFVNLQKDIDLIANHVHQCHLVSSPTKYKVFLVSKRRFPLTPTSPFTLDGTVLEFVKTYRYLGVTFNSKLTWVDHRY